jgi:hypothetical protein
MYSVKSKIRIKENIIVSKFKYLRCEIPMPHAQKFINKNLKKFQDLCGTIKRSLGHKTRKGMQSKFYKTMTLPCGTYISEM